MARFNKIEIIEAMHRTGMVPVFYHTDAETTMQVIKACYAGGVRVFEFTNRGDFAHEVFGAVSRHLEKECPDMILGAGSIIDPATAALYLQLGADFIVGPCFNPEIARTCNRRLVPYIPGCGSATEIGMAQEAGCDVCKIFPAGAVGGPSFVKNILAPMPWTQIMATGSVEPTEENLSEWIHAGVCCVGIGSKLFPKDAITKGNWKHISILCSDVLEIIENHR